MSGQFIIVLPFPNYQLPITSLNKYDKCSTGHDIIDDSQLLIFYLLPSKKQMLTSRAKHIIPEMFPS